MIILLLTVSCLLSVSCATTSSNSPEYVDNNGNPITEEQFQDLEEERRLLAEEEAFFDACDAEGTGERGFFIDGLIGFWRGVMAIGDFNKDHSAEWWRKGGDGKR